MSVTLVLLLPFMSFGIFAWNVQFFFGVDNCLINVKSTFFTFGATPATAVISDCGLLPSWHGTFSAM